MPTRLIHAAAVPSGRIIWAKVKATTAAMRKVLHDANTPTADLYSGNEVSAFTFAKVYYKCGGIWLISGYSSDDVGRVLTKLGV
jgi:hypothetical protein